MLGHLKAEEFVSAMEGLPLTERKISHLRSCRFCSEKLESIAELPLLMKEMEAAVVDPLLEVEPDWTDFRSDVRNALFARSVRRDNSYHRLVPGQFSGLMPSWLPTWMPTWMPTLTPSGMLRPAVLALCLMLALGLSTALLLQENNPQKAQTIEEWFEPEGTAGSVLAIAGLGQADVFDDLLQLDEDEAENLRLLLEDLPQESQEGGQ